MMMSMSKGIFSIVLPCAVGILSLSYHFKTPPEMSYSHAHELVRAAYLYQELHNEEGEKAVWEEIQRLLPKSQDSPFSRYVLNSFEDQGPEFYINLSK
jgi:hypothetical protein